MARLGPDDVRDAVQRARSLLSATISPVPSDVTASLVELSNIRRSCSRSPLTEEAARLEDRLHALI